MELNIVSFSGGKDSVATWLYLAKDLCLPNVRCVFCDTGHESKLTYEYLKYLKSVGCPLTIMTPRISDRVPDSGDDRPMDFESLACLVGHFPTGARRFCTTFLKLAPLKRYVDRVRKLNPLLASGIRADESPKRAQMTPSKLWDDYMECYRWLPIHNWTAEKVFDYHRQFDIEPNPLYKHGMGRVGCFPCHMANKRELCAMAQRFPEAFDHIRGMEKRVADISGQTSTFFACDKIPARKCSENYGGIPIPNAYDVKKWALECTGESEHLTLDGDDPEAPACASVYGLCE